MKVLDSEFDDREISIAVVIAGAFTPEMARLAAKGDKAMEAEITALVYKSRALVLRHS